MLCLDQELNHPGALSVGRIGYRLTRYRYPLTAMAAKPSAIVSSMIDGK